MASINFVEITFLIITEVFAAQQKIQERTESSTDSCALITIMNADGIYLATYAALLLNLKLIRMNYYNEDCRQVPISEVSFIICIQQYLYMIIYKYVYINITYQK